MHTAKCLFAECQNKGTRQNTSLPSARKKALGKDAFCRVPKNSTRQNTSLPSARKKALGKDAFCWVFFFCWVYFIWHSAKTVFAECPIKYTRQSLRHSAKCRFPVVNFAPWDEATDGRTPTRHDQRDFPARRSTAEPSHGIHQLYWYRIIPSQRNATRISDGTGKTGHRERLQFKP